MSEPALKCENAWFKQIFTLKLFIAFKMAYSCCFSFGGNLDFPEFLQKNIYNINYWKSGITIKKRALLALKYCGEIIFPRLSLKDYVEFCDWI